MEKNAKINFTMHITQDADRSKTEYVTDANFTEKDDKFYLFFDERLDAEEEITKCRFEIENNSLRLRRNGPIVLEQLHISDTKTDGYLKTPFGRVETKTRTFQFSFVKRENGDYHLDLGYDLYTGDEKTGTYLLEMIIKASSVRDLRHE